MRLVVFNLFIAIALDCYNEVIRENLAIIGQSQIRKFLLSWADFDPNGTGFISFEELIIILFESKPPIGFLEDDKKKGINKNLNRKVYIQNKVIYQKMKHFNLPQYQFDSELKIHFAETI